MSYILKDVSFAEIDNVFRVEFREPMYLCTYVSEEVGEGTGEGGNSSNVL